MNESPQQGLSNTLIYGLIGALFGLLFPVVATLFDLFYIEDLPISWAHIQLVQKQQPLHWIIDTAPLFLGLFASLAGRKQDSLVLINEKLESKVRERTSSLEDKNRLLLQEIQERIIVEQQLVISKEEAIQARNAEEYFLANMSHEIRTPMNGVVGFTELLSQTVLTMEQREFVDSIRHSSSHLLAIINDILDISKIKAGHIEFEDVEIDVRELIRNISYTLKVSASTKMIQIFEEVDTDVPEKIVGDPVRLSQILLNLSNNAIKFTSKGHVKLMVHCLSISDHSIALEFEVEDTGIGIASHQIDKIFKDFKQAESNTTRKYGGTGLGLSISKKLVELQGGQINVRSELNKGSVFSFSIIFKKTIPETANLPKPVPEVKSIPDGCRILIVDDSRMNRVLANKVLEKGSDTVLIEQAENGMEAIQYYKESDYDIILLDLQMPVMDGFDTCKYIRTKFPESKRNIPIIALTAEALPQEKIKAFEVGMSDYVIKPFKREELYGKINFLLKR